MSMQSNILAYTKRTINEFGAATQRTFYSVYDANGTLVLHTSDKTLAMRTLEQLNNDSRTV